MKTTIPLFSIVLAFLSVTISPQVRATCQDACLTGNNTVQGDDALISLTFGTDNTAIGYQTLGLNTIGNSNTASGSDALAANSTGNDNTAMGFQALYHNTTGSYNTANGALALNLNTFGEFNTAIGFAALQSNTTGTWNTADGEGALESNTTGTSNTATGLGALEGNTIGDGNTATGLLALNRNISGNRNTANGVDALAINTTGSHNTAIGNKALGHNVSGHNNIAIGDLAAIHLTGGDNNIDVGNVGTRGDESGVIRIGTDGTHTSTFVAGIRGVTTGVADAIPVLIDSQGQLGTMSSSERFKTDIQPMDETSEALFALEPVTFHYKSDNKNTPQFGLIAEQVAKVNPELVVRDKSGKIYTVRYESVNAMLLNEFLKEHKAFVEEQRKVQEQGATIARLEQQIEALTIGLQKVSEQLELSKSAPQTVLNNR
jgi:hypothetical protein